MNQPFGPRALEAAIDAGLRFLKHEQRPSGGFPTVGSPHLDMAGAIDCPAVIYATTFVVHALTGPSFAGRSADPEVRAILERAGAFLRSEQDESGAWGFEGRSTNRIPYDLDDTSCAVAALLELGNRPNPAFYALLWQNEAAPGGPYYTWIGVNQDEENTFAREVDALVNANILFCAGLLELALPSAAAYLRGIIEARDYQNTSRYCVSPHFLLYAISRAFADGRVAELGPAMPMIQDDLLNLLPSPDAERSAFNVACVATGLLNTGASPASIAPYIAALLASQRDDGSWPAWAAYLSYAPNYEGAPALTTALALEACCKWLALER